VGEKEGQNKLRSELSHRGGKVIGGADKPGIDWLEMSIYFIM